MIIAREFLDWSRPALPAMAEYVLGRSRAAAPPVDLSQVIVVLPGRRACRELHELLARQAVHGLLLPTILTEGELPELLYEPARAIARPIVQRLAWGEAVRRLPAQLASRLFPERPDDGDLTRWVAIGELLSRLHRELAAELLTFADVRKRYRRPLDRPEHERWDALVAAQDEYQQIVAEAGASDRQMSRLEALRERRCRTDREIVLAGTVDLNQSTRAMLDQLTTRVVALVHAPPERQQAFDEYGCLRPEYWCGTEIDLPDEVLRIADGPAEQADLVVQALAELGGQWHASEMTIGLADESLAQGVRRRLADHGVASHWYLEQPLQQTSVYKLCQAAVAFLNTRGDPRTFADLVRHPDLTGWFAAHGLDDTLPVELDCYLSERLPTRLGASLTSPAPGSLEGTARPVQRALQLVRGWLARLQQKPRPLSQWADVLLEWLLEVYGERSCEESRADDRLLLGSLEMLIAALDEQAAIPDSLAPRVTGGQAVDFWLSSVADETIPPPPDSGAVELLGWLELPLDSAPVTVVTTFNEGFIPSSVGAELFLPNPVRRELGLLDNDRRYARDAYSLCSLLHSRRRLVLIAARRDLRGDPLLPSRLSLSGRADQQVRRILAFYEDDPLPASRSEVPPPSEADRAAAAGSGSDLSRSGALTGTGDVPGPGLAVPRPVPLAEPITTISVTAFRSYLACPYRFYLRHVLRLQSMTDKAEELTAGEFGTLLHEVLARFARSDVNTAEAPEAIREFCEATLAELASEQFGAVRRPAVSVQLAQLRQRLGEFAHWQSAHTREGWRIAFVESPDEEAAVPFPIGRRRSVLLRGRIDRIDFLEAENRWQVLDYKTGSDATDPQKAHRRRDGSWIDLQLPLYRHLAGHLGVTGRVELGYMALPAESGGTGVYLADWSEQDLRDADRVAAEVARRILAEEFWPPVDPPPGGFPEFAAICQDDVRERRLAP
jgi:hypothetical protein